MSPHVARLMTSLFAAVFLVCHPVVLIVSSTPLISTNKDINNNENIEVRMTTAAAATTTATTTAVIRNNENFPTIQTTIQMALLSSLIYAFHKEDYGNNDVGNHVCDRINNVTASDIHHIKYNCNNKYNNSRWRRIRRRRQQQSLLRHEINNRTIPNNIRCEWYHHDWIDGVQIMIVTSIIDHSITIIFAGTDDMTTSLTDMDILLSNFGYNNNDAAVASNESTTNMTNRTTRSSSSSSSTNSVNNTDPIPPPPIYPNISFDSDNPYIRVHSGFDTTLFNSRSNIFGQIIHQLQSIIPKMKQQQQESVQPKSDRQQRLKIYTTGHSLGGSYSVLTAVGLIQYYKNYCSNKKNCLSSHRNIVQKHHASTKPTTTTTTTDELPDIISLTFGCPQIGNSYWRDYIHDHLMNSEQQQQQQRLAIYRVVLGWDIVPRLPSLLQHVGHTIQLSRSTTTVKGTSSKSSWYIYPWDNSNTTTISNVTTAVYYHHIGNSTLFYSSVPFGWSATPFIWIPNALFSHYITAYIQCLLDIQKQLYNNKQQQKWITDFERIAPIPPDGNGNKTIYDDDYYVDPPEMESEN